MNLEAVIVPKISKLEWDMKNLGLTQEEVLAKYRKEGVKATAILKSHQYQLRARKELADLLKGVPIIERDDFCKKKASQFDLVVTLGGDNHFQYVAQCLDTQLIVGINSDPTRSEGALTKFNVDTFTNFLNRLKSGRFQTEEWTRLEVKLNNQVLKTLSLCDIFLGEAERKEMSRYIIEFEGEKQEHKNSGLLVTTGSGSTGWYDSACRYCLEDGNKFAKTSKLSYFLATEPYRGKLNGSSLLTGEIREGETLTIRSLNDCKGKVIVDSLEEFDFNRGSKVTIRLSNKPLKVVLPN